MNIVDIAKNLATVLGTVATLGYVAGYLAIRARAAALGTDPTFSLVDEAYVFAGFRFLFITIILLLLATPFVLLARWGVMSLRADWSGAPALADWMALAVLVVVVLWIVTRTMAATGVLLTPTAEYSAWHQAVLGDETIRRLGLTMLTLTLFSLTALWLHARWQVSPDSFDYVLVIVLAIQTFLLPIQHGSYFADRRVRVLDSVPSAVSSLHEPVAIIDGTSSHATLLGYNAGGARRLANVKREDLNGLPVRQTMLLSAFLAKPPLVPEQASSLAHPEEEIEMSEADESKSSFFASLLKKLNITLEQIGSLGNSGVDGGELWMIELDAAGDAGSPTRIGDSVDLAWPVSNREQVFALQHNQLVELTAGAPSPHGDSTTFWHKLVGVSSEGVVVGIVLDEDDALRRATLAVDGSLSTEAQSNQGERQMAHLLQESRSYKGGRSLQVNRPESGRGFDVFFKSDNESQNVSNCQGDSCGHPSLSTDGKRIFFIRRPRY